MWACAISGLLDTPARLQCYLVTEVEVALTRNCSVMAARDDDASHVQLPSPGLRVEPSSSPTRTSASYCPGSFFTLTPLPVGFAPGTLCGGAAAESHPAAATPDLLPLSPAPNVVVLLWCSLPGQVGSSEPCRHRSLQSLHSRAVDTSLHCLDQVPDHAVFRHSGVCALG